MKTLEGKQLYLRALEVKDLDFLYELENDENIWYVSDTITPYSKFTLKKYLENAHQDIFQAKQLRLTICTHDHEILGLVDVFDFNPLHKRAGVGVVIKNKIHRNKGYAKEALALVINYCFKHLQLHQLYCTIGVSNKASITLFEGLGFMKTGVKKEWNLVNGRFEDELFYQLIP